MKKFTKVMLVSSVTLLLGMVATVNYLYARSGGRVSDLTLANIEAMADSNKVEQVPIVQGPAKTDRHECRACKTHHVICEGKEHGGDCVNIHCLM